MQSKTTSEETLRVDLPQYTCDSLREASKNLFPSQAWLELASKFQSYFLQVNFREIFISRQPQLP